MYFKKRIFLFFFLSISTIAVSDTPPEERVLEDYYHIYLGVERYEGNELDTSIYNITDNDFPLFPDQKEEEELGYDIIRTSSFDISEVEVNYYEGYYTDTLKLQCVVLISPEDFYPAGPAWGLPCSVLILYTKEESEWKLTYACPFYHEAETIVFDEKSKLNLLYVRIDYGAMGMLQWIESVYRFKGNKLEEIYYELSSNDAMREQMRYLEDKSSFKKYEGGDTLGRVILKEDIRDIDGDGVREMICRESLVISAKPRKGELQMNYFSRERIYAYKNGALLLRTFGPFLLDEND